MKQTAKLKFQELKIYFANLHKIKAFIYKINV